MTIAERMRLEALERTVEELVQEFATLQALLTLSAPTVPPQPDALLARNAERQANADRLKEAIDAILTKHPSATGKECLRELKSSGWTPLPSVRTVQRHMLRQRHTSCGVRDG